MSQELILYRTMKEGLLFDQIAELLTQKAEKKKKTMSNSFTCAGQLVRFAETYGFEGNLWHCFLTFCLVNNENPYSISCELVGTVKGTLKDLAYHDFGELKNLFDYDIGILDQFYPQKNGIWNALSHYQAGDKTRNILHKPIRDGIVSLAVSLKQSEDVETFAKHVNRFYQTFGVGKYGLNAAFRIEEAGKELKIKPITNIEDVQLKDIVGYELQKQKLVENTEAFLNGNPANNVLLFGDSGTGKSSCMKAILNEYYKKGLRMVEVYKHQFHALSSIQEQIKDRNYKFIICMDDLSFEESELEYKYLKAIIEGGLGKKPSNVLIYATSNRRHLIREKFSDKREADDELHTNDTVQEKLSLAARFGVTIYYGSPDKMEFNQIVKELAERNDIKIPLEVLYEKANVWELTHGGLSGRTASQFITHLLGNAKKEENGTDFTES